MNGRRPSTLRQAQDSGRTALVLLLAVFALTGATTNISSGRARKSEPAPPEPSPVAQPAPEQPPAEPPAAASPPAPEEPVPAPVSPPVPAEPAPKPESVPTATPENPVPAVPETVWLDDDLPAGATAEGTWVWDSSNFAAGTRSHGHPSEKGVHSHGYNMEKPVTIPPGSMVTQQVWLDPGDPPKGISLKFRLSTGEEAGVYWEGEEEVFKPGETQELWYYGPLPELGKWTTLEVLAEDLGMENSQIAGVRFTTYDGKVLWDRTVLKAAPPIEEPQDLLQGPVEIRPERTSSLRAPKARSNLS